MGWLKEHWQIVTSLVAGLVFSLGVAYKAVAWQMNQDAAISNDRLKIESIEDVQFQQQENLDQIVEIQTGQARLEERTELMLRMLERIERRGMNAD